MMSDPGAGVCAEPFNVAAYEALARERLDPGTYGYFAGGAGDERTLAANLAAFGRWDIRPRVLVDVSDVSARTTLLGTDLSMPLLVAPIAFQRLCDPGGEGEPALARAAAAAGTIMCLSTLATASPTDVAAAAPDGRRWLQVYCFRDRGVTRSLIDEAVDAGFEALVLTADTPRAGRRERDLGTGFAVPPETRVPSLAAAGAHGGSLTEILSLLDPSLDWDDLAELIAGSPLPVLVKGILGEEDARLAVEAGAAGVIVSNHGGRQLDGAPATLDVLAEVAAAVGDDAELLLDGGVRRGVDVVKALALGARAVLAGRAPLWGLAAHGEPGARRVLELLCEEIELALQLTGCVTPDAVSRAHVRPRAAP